MRAPRACIRDALLAAQRRGERAPAAGARLNRESFDEQSSVGASLSWAGPTGSQGTLPERTSS